MHGSCPQCAALLEQARRSRAGIGKPFEECSACGDYVPMQGTDEWELMPVTSRLRCLVHTVVTTLMLAIFPGLAYALYTVAADIELRVQLVLGWCAFGLAGAAYLRGTSLSTAIRRSRGRLEDPMYRARLIEFASGQREPGQPR